MDPTTVLSQLDAFSVPWVSLPPSFHEKSTENASPYYGVYRHSRNLTYMWRIAVCALFKGQIAGKFQEVNMDEVKHELFVMRETGIIILIVVELAVNCKISHDHCARILLELEAAYRQNTTREFASKSPVYAVLSNTEEFYFLQYDGRNFTRYEGCNDISYHSLQEFSVKMKKYNDILFSLLLQGYISALTVISQVSSNDGRFPSIAERDPGMDIDFDAYRDALSLALSAQDALKKADYASEEACEAAGAHGLSLFQSSVQYLSCDVGTETPDQIIDSFLRRRYNTFT